MIVAAGQMEATTLSDSEKVWPMVDRLADHASDAGADLLLLPETTYPAYWLESIERYMQPDIERMDKVLDRYAKIAAAQSIWLVVGFIEENKGKLHNSAAVFDRSGNLVGIARKSFLWDCDNRWVTPGESLSVFDTEFGTMGLLICADARTPEIANALVSSGADFIVEPTAWINASKVRRTYRNVQADFMIRARAMEFAVPFVCASKAGREGELLEYVGQSQIVDAAGNVLAKAPVGGEHLLHAEIHPAPGRPAEMDEATQQRLTQPEPPYRAANPGGKISIRIQSDADAIIKSIEVAGGRVAGLPTSELPKFPRARCAALDGAQVLVYRGRISDDAFARTRAAESRVFVLIASDSVQYVIAPDGAIMWRTADGGSTVELDLSLADDKRYTPVTDIWDQRRPACYRSAPPQLAFGAR